MIIISDKRDPFLDIELDFNALIEKESNSKELEYYNHHYIRYDYINKRFTHKKILGQTMFNLHIRWDKSNIEEVLKKAMDDLNHRFYNNDFNLVDEITSGEYPMLDYGDDINLKVAKSLFKKQYEFDSRIIYELPDYILKHYVSVVSKENLKLNKFYGIEKLFYNLSIAYALKDNNMIINSFEEYPVIDIPHYELTSILRYLKIQSYFLKEETLIKIFDILVNKSIGLIFQEKTALTLDISVYSDLNDYLLERGFNPLVIKIKDLQWDEYKSFDLIPLFYKKGIKVEVIYTDPDLIEEAVLDIDSEDPIIINFDPHYEFDEYSLESGVDSNYFIVDKELMKVSCTSEVHQRMIGLLNQNLFDYETGILDENYDLSLTLIKRLNKFNYIDILK